MAQHFFSRQHLSREKFSEAKILLGNKFPGKICFEANIFWAKFLNARFFRFNLFYHLITPNSTRPQLIPLDYTSYHPTTPHTTRPHLIPLDYTSNHPTTPDPTRPHLIPPYHTSYHPTTTDTTRPHLIPSYHT